ncbi:MAG: hypothetical protein PUC82_04970 [bacterium]|nr:hypothetical protein [bacterium]
MGKLTSKETKIISSVLATWGLLFVGSGLTMKEMQEPTKIVKSDLEIIQKRVSETKTNEIKLKDMELEINKPLSVNVKDYLANLEEIDLSIVKNLKLDTSMVNPTQVGEYTYTIAYEKKKYNGTFKIKEKELPKVELTVKDFKLALNSPLKANPEDLSTYIEEELTDEVKNNITIDLSQVRTDQEGIYDYTVTYNGTIYKGKIEVYQPQTKIITPNQIEENNEKTKTEQEKDTTQDEKITTENSIN